MNTYQTILDELSAIKVEYQGIEIDFDWSEPTDPAYGLVSSSVAFKLAKQLATAPVEIAQSLTEQLSSAVSNPLYVCTSVGPYINVSLTEEGLAAVLNDAELWTQPKDASTHLLFEYVGLNAAKKPHIGHMRNINIGEALFRILCTKYTHITTDNHWGDWGVQFGIVIWAYKRNLDKQAYKEDPLSELQRLYVWGNQQKEVVDNWEAEVREEFKKLEDGEAENRALWQEFVKLSQVATKGILEAFNVTPHDLNQGESFYEPYMKQLSEYMEAHDIWSREGEARYFDFEQMAQKFDGSKTQTDRIAQLGRCYLVSSTGYTTYAYRDVAARLQWMHDLHADLAMTITDYKQAHSFAQAFAIIAYLAQRDDFKEQWGVETAQRLSLNSLVHIPYGRLKIFGQQLSSRLGNVMDLEAAYEAVTEAVTTKFEYDKKTTNNSIIEKVTIASLKWADLNRDRTSDVDLNPEEIIAVEGDTGVYQLYTLARLYSILDKAADTSESSDVEVSLFNEVEQQLLGQLAHSAAALHKATRELAPHHVAIHLRSVAQAINSWYAQYYVLQETDTARQQQLLILVKKLIQHLEKGLQLLAIQPVKQL